MAKLRLNRFLIDRIHPAWIDRLYPDDERRAHKLKDKGVKDRG